MNTESKVANTASISALLIPLKHWLRDPAAWILPALITLALFNGLVKSLTGIRYGPLIIDAALLLLLLAGLATRMIHNHLTIGVLDILAAVFMSLAVLEMFNPNIPSFQAGLEGFRKFAFMLVGFFIGRYLVNLFTIKRLMACLIGASFFIALYGVKQYLLPSALDYRLIELSTGSPVTYLMGGHIRAFSTLSGPFHLGIFLVGTCTLLVCLWFQYKSLRLWVMLLILPQVVALFMTVTKSNWAALMLGGVIIILLYSKNLKKVLVSLFILGLIILLLGLVALELTSTIPQFKTIHDGLQAIINPLQAPTMIIRLDLWRDTVLPLIQQSPWFGYGTGSAGEGLVGYFANTGRVYAFAHNMLFKVQIEMGLFGLLLFLVFLGMTILQVWRVNRHLRDPFLKMFTNWALAFSAGMFVSSLTGSILDAYPVNLIFWLVLGIASRLYHLEQRPDVATPNSDPIHVGA